MPDGFRAQQIRDIVASAEKVELEPPRPLMRELPPATPFPDEALGNILGPAARAINDRVRAPMAICGQSVLAAANLAVQAHADVELPIGRGLAKPTSNFFVTVAVTGERKSASDAEANGPIGRREQMLRLQYDADLPAYTQRQDGLG
jgi:putative DNA primase/helicase